MAEWVCLCERVSNHYQKFVSVENNRFTKETMALTVYQLIDFSCNEYGLYCCFSFTYFKSLSIHFCTYITTKRLSAQKYITKCNILLDPLSNTCLGFLFSHLVNVHNHIFMLLTYWNGSIFWPCWIRSKVKVTGRDSLKWGG